MTLVETVLLALRNLKANKLRTFLSVLGVMVGVGAVITVISVGMSAQAEIARNISDLGSNMIAVVPNLNASQDPRKVMKFMTLSLAPDAEAAPALSAVSAVAQSMRHSHIAENPTQRRSLALSLVCQDHDYEDRLGKGSSIRTSIRRPMSSCWEAP